jgi:hypothetical protein
MPIAAENRADTESTIFSFGIQERKFLTDREDGSSAEKIAQKNSALLGSKMIEWE